MTDPQESLELAAAGTPPAADPQAEIAALKDRLLRAAADADNARKRSQRELEDTQKYAVTSFARDLVNVAENLQRALEALPPSAGDPALKSLSEGVTMTQKELLAAFEKHGIRRIHPLGEKFDHHFHQAVMHIPSADHDAGTVVQVLQAGYVIHDRLLRPAMVGVAKAADTPPAVDTVA